VSLPGIPARFPKKFSQFGSAVWQLFYDSNVNIIVKIKQDIHIHVSYSRPNGGTEWAEIFCGDSWVAESVLGLKKKFYIFSTGNAGPFR